MKCKKEQVFKIKDLLECVIDNRGKTPPIEQVGYNLIEINSIATKNRYPDYSVIKKHVNEFTYKSSFRAGHPKRGDILIPTVGTLDAICLMDRNDCCIAQNLIALRANEKVCNNEYLYYMLCNPIIRKRVLNLDIGGVQPSIKVPHLLNLEIDIPDVIIQKKVANILSIIDDKIELNNKINKNLEEQILSYYQKLFIKPNNESSKWSVLELSNVTINIRDKVGDNNYPVFSAINTGNLQFSEDYFNKQVFSKDISKYIVVDKNDFAYNPARINIGSIGINDLEVIGCVSPVYVVFRVEKGYHNFFNIYIKSNNFKEEVKTRASGSVRQTLNYEDFAKIQIQYPPKEVIEKFNDFCDPLLLSIKTINTETKKLIELRDTLLPKLMSGEIDVSKINI